MKLRPMSEAPRDGTEILVYWPSALDIDNLEFHTAVAHYPSPLWTWMALASGVYFAEDNLVGWLPIPYPEGDA